MTIELPRTFREGALDDLVERQASVVSRAQLARRGISLAVVDAQLRAERWRSLSPTVVALTNGALSPRQRWWHAVLSGPDLIALASSTALALHGLRGLAEDKTIHVVVPRSSMMAPIRGVRIHESRRFGPDDVVVRAGLPTCTAERAAIDAVAWQRRARFAYALVPAVVQQRLGTTDRFDEELDAAGSVRHAGHLRCAVSDVRGGADALSEIDLRRTCRRYGLQQPVGQRVRYEPSGRKRYLDAEWVLADGSVVVLEVDGAHHLEVQHWEDDMRRERAIVIDGRTVLRCTAREIRLEPAAIAADLRSIGIPPSRA
ncbi:MAG: hypothetical protein Q7T56_04030 [Nocardioidaceae bacterium]|nr:hypothetical protein [Nocardioidaceae bacterium]